MMVSHFLDCVIASKIITIKRFLSTFESRRVVVTGLGSVTPLGTDAKTSWYGLLKKRSGIRSITDDMNDEDEKYADVYEQLPSRVAGRVDRKEFEIKRDKLIGKSQLRTMARTMAFSIVSSEEALRDAGLNYKESCDLIGVAIGNGMVDLAYIGESFKTLYDRKSKISPYFVPKILPNLNPGHVSLHFGLRGPLHSVSTACATGAHAIGDAFNFIKTGAADAMLAGGTDACVNPLSVAGFCRARALSTNFNGRPEEASRPFHKQRDGFVIAEGCGILLLEELGFALRRGAKIYAEVVGYGLSGDAFHLTAGRDDGEGALMAMIASTKQLSHLPGDRFELCGINAHATSTPKGDRSEILAVTKFLRCGNLPTNLSVAGTVQVTSHKGNLGHLLGGSGSTESCFAVMALKEGRIPATLNLDDVDDVDDFDIDPQHLKIATETVLLESSGGKRRLIAKNSFGFGGTNVTLLFAEYNT